MGVSLRQQRHWRLFVFLLLLLLPFMASQENPQIYNFGAALSSSDNVAHFIQTIQDINFNINKLPPTVTLHAATILLNPNPFQAALSVCDSLIAHQVSAVVVSHSATGELSPAALSYTCGFYHIPVIGISSRDAAFSDKENHVSFLRTVPSYSQQTDVWVELLNHFKYKNVVLFHSLDVDGNSILKNFQTKIRSFPDEDQIKVEKINEFQPGLTSILNDLQDTKLALSQVYLLYANTEDAEVIFREAEILNMTGKGSVWLVTEQALEASNRPDGILSLKLVNASDEISHIKDSTEILAKALQDMYYQENITEAPKGCYSSVGWDTGQTFLKYIKEVVMDGDTGHVAFDENGDRLYAEYEIINIQDGQPVPIGYYSYSNILETMELNINEDQILWPGKTRNKPKGFEIPSHLKVATLVEKPFVWARRVEQNESCTKDEVLCLYYNNTDSDNKNFCCWGYCIELLQALAVRINFTYTLHLVEDGQYGIFDKRNGSDTKEWSGLIGELINDKADMVVAPLTNNEERSQVVDFSKPFKYHGITILEKRQPKGSALVSFLQPFQNTLWILVMVAVHVVAVALYFLDWLSPFKVDITKTPEEEPPTLSSAIWFAWGVLLSSGIGDGTPRSFSARVLGMVWAGFTMIIVASYTANLAAFLVLDRPEKSLSGINDPRLRNPMEDFTCATIKGSAVDMYLHRQPELSNMYRAMESNNYDTVEEAVEAIKTDALKAFLWDSPRLQYEAAEDCDLVTAGELFGSSSYSVALKKNSHWTEAVTLAILSFHESGLMENLDDRWIQSEEVNCQQNDNASATLGLKSMAGVFLLVAVGLVGGVGLVIIEIIYKKHQLAKQRKKESARVAAKKWRGVVEKRKTLRASLEEQKRLRDKKADKAYSKPNTPQLEHMGPESILV